MTLDVQPVDGSLVMSEMIALDEAFAAEVTFEAFASVSSDVGFEIVALREAFVAEAVE